MAVEAGMVIFEIVLAIIELVTGTAISEDQMKRQNSRTARQAEVSSYYEAAQNIYGLTAQKLDQILAKWDLKMSQLAESTRGSARLSKASKIYREYIQKYPDAVQRINKAKNTILNESGRMASQNTKASSAIQNGKGWQDYTTNTDIAKSNNLIATDLTGVHGPDDSKVNQGFIDTNLSSKPAVESKDQKGDWTHDKKGYSYDWNGNGALEGWEMQKGPIPGSNEN